MKEPLTVDAGFLRSAYQAVLGLRLDSETEFVTGQFPFFMFQTAGVLVSVTMSDRKYGAAENRNAFPHHDLSAVNHSLGFLDRRRLAKHEGWISASLLREQFQTAAADRSLHMKAYALMLILLLAISSASAGEKLPPSVVELPRPNSGAFSFQQAEARKSEILSNSPSPKLENWKNPSMGFCVHVGKYLRCTIHGHLGYSDGTVFDGVRRRHKVKYGK